MALQLNLSLLPILLLAQPTPINPLHTRAANSGQPSWASIFLFTMGMQNPLQPSILNAGEFPACAALTTGYVFRVENEATVAYLQEQTSTGALTHFSVSSLQSSMSSGIITATSILSYIPITVLLTLVLSSSISTTTPTPILLSLICLLFSRFFNTLILRAQTQPSWHGASEPGVKGSLLILLSRDRWARISGLVDDLKAVTSGAWLAAPLSQPGHSSFSPTSTKWALEITHAAASLLVYIAAITLSATADNDASVIAVVLCVGITHFLVMWENAAAKTMVCQQRIVAVDETKAVKGVKVYGRRLEMAKDLIEETGRRDWAVRMGMVPAEKGEAMEGVTM